MITVNLNDRYTFQLPEHWNELNAGQLTAIAPLLHKATLTPAERWYISWQLCSFGNRIFSSVANHTANGYQYLADQFRTEILPHLDFLFKKNELTRNLLPVLYVRKRFAFFGTTALYGPADDFNSLTLEEFSDTEFCLDMYEHATNPEEKEKWLHNFFAILYRPKRKGIKFTNSLTADVRVPYERDCNELLGAMLKTIDPREKSAIMLWYMGCRANLAACFPAVFTKGKAAQGSGAGSWAHIAHALAGPKFGTIAQTEKANLKVVFTEITLQAEQQKN